jgi:Tfp pilus assembly protein PilV
MRNHAGFTLIETVMTTLILVTGLAAVAGAFVYGIQTSVRTRQQTTAFALLAEKMEILRGFRREESRNVFRIRRTSGLIPDNVGDLFGLAAANHCDRFRPATWSRRNL